ncbi:ATPase [Azorhizobium oxalatiphilum]|uniref:ATPase n=1 Tax=Azorhizobium oxalatiphilum TaxID=980631 RepID=A0A917BZ18_9HYPH|nr:HAD-IC family P-type ATPase [Azorhizobium oxalatiphilum]GGF62121.1 ATPase [Azorhizobium oxalatiphilum]
MAHASPGASGTASPDTQAAAHEPSGEATQTQTTLLAPAPRVTGPQGLSPAEAARRLKLFGRNSLEDLPRQPPGQLLLGALKHTLALLLLAAAALYTAMGDVTEGFFLIGCAGLYVLLAVIRQIQRDRIRVALHRLAEPAVRVRRDGRPIRLPAGDLVPGDVIAFAEGERMPADGVLLSSDPVTVDESMNGTTSIRTEKYPAGVAASQTLASDAWTPEAVAQTWIFPGRVPSTVLLRGALNLRGRGFVQIAATGVAALGRGGPTRTLLDDSPSPLQLAAGQIARRLALVGICFCVLVTVVTGLFQDDWYLGGLAGIALALALAPQELPLQLDLLLAHAARRLSRVKVLARRGTVVETIGATTVLCVGKTGLLTEGRITLTALREAGGTLVLAPGVPVPTRGHALLRLALYATPPAPTDALDRAILAVTDTALPPPDARLVEAYPRRRDLNAYVQHWRAPGGGDLFAAKGAPEAIARLCHLEGHAYTAMERDAAEFAAHGLHVLAVAYRQVAKDVPTPKGTLFTFAGLIAFSDPVRSDVPQAMGEARRAGVKVLLVTGDHPATAREVARQSGIDTTAGVLTGAEIARLTPESLITRVREVRVFARIQPEQKLAIVTALRNDGEVVAVTGDNEGDVPALAAAQIGIAVSRRAPDAVRQVAGLVLLDDRFASLVAGIRSGRRVFNNLRRSLVFIATVRGAMAGLAFVPLLMGVPPLLYPVHVVLVGLLAGPLTVLVFRSEPGNRHAMSRPPRAASEALFGSAEITSSLLQGLVLLAVLLALYVGAVRLDHPGLEARTCAFLALLMTLPVLAFASSAEPGARLFGRQRGGFWAVTALVVVIVALVLLLPQAAILFRLGPITPVQMALALILALVAGGWGGLLRRFGQP